MGSRQRTLYHAYFKLMGETTLDGECWVKKRRPKGRPVVSVDGRRYLASRVVLYATKGLDPDFSADLACHRCGNIQCYNPHHLYIGDRATNATDGIRQSTRSLS